MSQGCNPPSQQKKKQKRSSLLAANSADTQRDRQTERHTDRQTDRETDRQRDRETDRQRDRQTDRETHRQTPCRPAVRGSTRRPCCRRWILGPLAAQLRTSGGPWTHTGQLKSASALVNSWC